jgi:hypothetical protein
VQVVALLRQNPAVAVPTVLNRLSQKDVEWRQVGCRPHGWLPGLLSHVHVSRQAQACSAPPHSKLPMF